MSYWIQNLSEEFQVVKDNEQLPVFKNRSANIAEMFWKTVNLFPDRLALVYEDQQLTYAQVGERVNRVAYNLTNHYGVKPGDRVAVLFGNGFHFPICFFAIAQIGAISVPLNTRLTGHEIIHEIENSKSKILIMEDEFWSQIILIKNQIPSIESIFISGEIPDEPAILSFDTLLKPYNGEQVFIPVKETQACSILYTSGTTGTPKGAVLTHRGLIGTGMNFACTFQLQQEDSTLLAIPIFHITGMLQFLGSIYRGIPVYLMRTFKTDIAIDLIGHYKPTILVGVPTIYWFILSSPQFNPDHFRQVRALLYGGAPAPVSLIKLLREKIPQAKIHNGYGLTEGHGLDTLLPDEDALRKPDSIGLPVPLVECKIVDEKGASLEPNQIGELAVRGSKIMMGYWENQQATSKAIKDGWLRTGDLAKMDEEGYVYIVDRKKDIINRGGEKIYSIEVENILYSFPKVLEATVFGAVDEKYGEQVIAAIVLKPGESVTEDEVKEFCKTKLAKYKIPKYVEFLEQLPRNAGGKVLKHTLRKSYSIIN
ncbi:AMP-dependent synthetase and ligase [Neobacillus bataviensis LMG 21833]|uniref:AMP-dependent synthetase and ligase n=1 Tax=Neobacillus bataviensis LMG 21833 TaxID=1117379 RepID=K6DTU2_9BACI|nr:class I adenylate-forming enzyme family protein [Neobacillus bataviensis]EKN71673.1 AMP-dependent synthetase and ligase [Neobacillus bataviensis LMG 21833]